MLNLPNKFLENMKILLGKEYPTFLLSLNQNEQKAIFVNNNKISTKEFLKVVNFKTEQIEYENNGLYIENLKLVQKSKMI